MGVIGNKVMPSQVKHSATRNDRGFELHKGDDPHFRVLRAIYSRKAQDVFQEKLKEGSNFYMMAMFRALQGMSQGSVWGVTKYCVTDSSSTSS